MKIPSLKKAILGPHVRAAKQTPPRIARFQQDHGYTPDLANPTTYSEKLLKRILEDDDPHYPLYGSKLAVPFFLAARDIPGLHFPRRLAVHARLHPEHFTALPGAFVIKSSFGSGLNRIVKDKATEDFEAICAHFNDRLHTLRNARDRSDPQNCIIIEELLSKPDGRIPADLKFHCFHSPDGGFRHVLQIDTERFDDHAQSLVDEEYRLLPLRFARTPPHETLPPRPAQLSEAIRIARQASEGFDYTRVDLYNVGGKIYFGEFTPFHQGGHGKVTPQEWDRKLGEMWHLRLPSYQPVTGSSRVKD